MTASPIRIPLSSASNASTHTRKRRSITVVRPTLLLQQLQQPKDKKTNNPAAPSDDNDIIKLKQHLQHERSSSLDSNGTAKTCKIDDCFLSEQQQEGVNDSTVFHNADRAPIRSVFRSDPWILTSSSATNECVRDNYDDNEDDPWTLKRANPVTDEDEENEWDELQQEYASPTKRRRSSLLTMKLSDSSTSNQQLLHWSDCIDTSSAENNNVAKFVLTAAAEENSGFTLSISHSS